MYYFEPLHQRVLIETIMNVLYAHVALMFVSLIFVHSCSVTQL